MTGCYPERACQTLKNMTISNETHRYRLEKNSSDRVCVARLVESPGLADLFRTASNF
jgi:hypothetical protein